MLKFRGYPGGRRVYVDLAKIDWTNKDDVIALAKRLGRWNIVYKHPARKNYNITHRERTDRYLEHWVVFWNDGRDM